VFYLLAPFEPLLIAKMIENWVETWSCTIVNDDTCHIEQKTQD